MLPFIILTWSQPRDETDLETFQRTLPNFSNTPTNSLSSPISPTFPSPGSVVLPLPSNRQVQASHLQQQHPLSHQQQQPPSRPHSQNQHQQSHQLSSTRQTFIITARLFSLPLRLSAICRKVHAVLTGREAHRRAERGLPIDSDGLQEVWDGLDACWDDFDAIRRSAIGISGEEVERYIGSWQIFIFECRESRLVYCRPFAVLTAATW